MSLLEVYIHPSGLRVSGPKTALALKLRIWIPANYEELWTN
jgi:hypothetical protein